jgi:hypothetical protein
MSFVANTLFQKWCHLRQYYEKSSRARLVVDDGKQYAVKKIGFAYRVIKTKYHLLLWPGEFLKLKCILLDIFRAKHSYSTCY